MVARYGSDPRGGLFSRMMVMCPRALLVGMGVLALLALSGCDDDDDGCLTCPDEEPAAPRGLYSITGDGHVTLVWYANTEPDLDGYAIYRNDTFEGQYDLIAEITPCGDCLQEEVDVPAPNGVTYYYAVAAIDHGGHPSLFSYEEVSDTPRPEGTATIGNSEVNIDGAGFDLSEPGIVAADDPQADFYYFHDAVGGLIVAGSLAFVQDNTEIQDMGYTSSLDEIGYAPASGWSPLQSVEAIAGHTYVLLTRDRHYAKILVTAFGSGGLTFDWAYQTQLESRELSHPLKP
jgi:hypothetical protein